MPPTLGQRLKHAREQAGLSLPDLSHETRIPVPRLQDLEEDNYNAFGSLTYARSFLEIYSDRLGVDPHAVTEHMKPTPLGGASDYRYLTETLGAWIEVKTDQSLMPAARPVRPTRVSGVVAAICGLLLLIGGVIWAAAYWNERNLDQKPVVPETSPAPVFVNPAFEEIRPAEPNKTGDVPVKKALPVDDKPAAKPKR